MASKVLRDFVLSVDLRHTTFLSIENIVHGSVKAFSETFVEINVSFYINLYCLD